MSGPREDVSSSTTSTGTPVSRVAVLGGIGDRGRRQHEDRMGAVARAHAAQPADHLGDVRAENAAVVVTFVDDDVVEAAQERGPPRVLREQAGREQIGVAEHVVGVSADPVTLLARGVTVVRGGSDTGQGKGAHGRELVAGQRLGRCEVDRAGRSAPPGAG